MSFSRTQDFPRKVELTDALRKIAWLRPAGEVSALRLKDAHRLIHEIEQIALTALERDTSWREHEQWRAGEEG